MSKIMKPQDDYITLVNYAEEKILKAVNDDKKSISGLDIMKMANDDYPELFDDDNKNNDGLITVPLPNKQGIAHPFAILPDFYAEAIANLTQNKKLYFTVVFGFSAKVILMTSTMQMTFPLAIKPVHLKSKKPHQVMAYMGNEEKELSFKIFYKKEDDPDHLRFEWLKM